MSAPRPGPAPALPVKPPIWLLVLITISGTMAMHMFVPALPQAGADLHASVPAMQMTISLYIAGLAFGQLFYGPLSDAFGRQPLLLIGLGLYACASFAAAVSPGVHLLVGARLVQALGGCAGLALGRAIVRDTAGTVDVVRQLALMNLMMMIGPGLAPMAGGALAATLGWRAIFLLLGSVGLLTWALTYFLLRETGKPTGSVSTQQLARHYRHLLGSPIFLGFALGGGCATTALYGFIAAAPFIFTAELHVPVHEVGIYLGLLVAGMAAGNALTSRLISKVAIERLLLGGNVLSIVSAALLLASVLAGVLSVPLVITLMFFFTMGSGIASPAALTKSVSVDPQLVGSASGLYGCSQMVVGAACTALVGLGRDPALSAGCVLLGAAVCAQGAFWIALLGERAARRKLAVRHGA